MSRSHPNKAVDVVAHQTFPINLGFSAINASLFPCSRLLQQFFPWLTLVVRQPPPALSLRTCPGVAARMPLHSPRGSAARRRASAPPLPPLSSSHSFHHARRASAHTVVSPCLVRTAPKYIARRSPAACAPSCLQFCYFLIAAASPRNPPASVLIPDMA